MTTTSYQLKCNTPGWFRGVVTPKDGLSVTGMGLIDPAGNPVDTQYTPFNVWASGAQRHGLVIARLTQAGTYRLVADPPPLTLAPMPTPVWPRAFVSFTDGGKLYKAALPDFTDTDPWFDGPLAIERSVVVAPMTVVSPTPHPLVQVVYDVTSYRDGSTRLVVGITNARDTTAQAQVLMSGLTIQIGDSVLWGPKDQRIYEGQYFIKVGSVGHLQARVHQDPQVWYDAGVYPRVMSLVESPNYPAPDQTYDFGGFGDMPYSVPMNSGGGRPELGPIFTKAQAEYLVHQTDAIYDHVIAQGNLAGSWSGYLCGPDGTTLTVDPDHGNKSKLGYGQYYMVDGPHLLDLTTMPFLLTGDRCYLRILQSWCEEILENLWKDAANTSSYGSDISYDYSCHGDGNLAFIGSSYFAEARGIGRVLRSLVNAATFTPKSQSKLKADLTTVVNQNLAKFDVYARRPPMGQFNPPGAEFDPGLQGSYGSVHTGYCVSSPWQWFEVAMALYHAYRHGFSTDLSLLKRIVGCFLGYYKAAPEADWPYIDGMYYPRVLRHVLGGPHTAMSWPEIKDANWVTPPAGGWDGNDNNGNPGLPYYSCEYHSTLLFAKWLKMDGYEKPLAHLRPKALADAPGRAHYAFDDFDGDLIVRVPDPVPLPGPTPMPTYTMTAEIWTANETDPDHSDNKASVSFTSTSSAQPPPPQRTAALAIIKPLLSQGPPSGQPFTVSWGCRNTGPDGATGVMVFAPIAAGLTFVRAVPSKGTYTSDNGRWVVGEIAPGATETLDLITVAP